VEEVERICLNDKDHTIEKEAICTKVRRGAGSVERFLTFGLEELAVIWYNDDSTYSTVITVCRKTLLGSKDEVLWRVEGTQYPRNIAPPPLGEGLGWGQSLGF